MIKVNASDVCNRIGVQTFDETILHKALQRVPAVSSAGPWIAGGAVRKTIQGAPLSSDFDFFFASQEQADAFSTNVRGMGASLLYDNEKNSTYILPTSVVNLDDKSFKLPEMKIQAICFRYYASAEEVIDSFDFTISQFAYDGESIFMADFALWDLARKRLVPHRISYATSSLRRIIKYANEGFTVCSGGLSEILNQVVADPTVIHSETLYID